MHPFIPFNFISGKWLPVPDLVCSHQSSLPRAAEMCSTFSYSHIWAHSGLSSLFKSFLHHCPVPQPREKQWHTSPGFRSLSGVFCWELTQTRVFCLDFCCCVVAPISRLCFIILFSQSCFITSCPTASFQPVFLQLVRLPFATFPYKTFSLFVISELSELLLHETRTKPFPRLPHPFCCFCSISRELWAGFLTKYIVQGFNSTYFFSAAYLKETL